MRGRWERTDVRDRTRISQATQQFAHYDTPFFIIFDKLYFIVGVKQ